MKICSRTNTIILAILAMIPASSWSNFGADGDHRRPEPPQRAIDACLDKSEGASVEMADPQGDTMKAVCKKMGSQLVAVPEGPPPGEKAPKDGAREE